MYFERPNDNDYLMVFENHQFIIAWWIYNDTYSWNLKKSDNFPDKKYLLEICRTDEFSGENWWYNCSTAG